MDDRDGTTADAGSGEPKGKRPYERPQIVWQEAIEARAVTCAKQPGNPPCAAGPVTS